MVASKDRLDEVRREPPNPARAVVGRLHGDHVDSDAHRATSLSAADGASVPGTGTRTLPWATSFGSVPTDRPRTLSAGTRGVNVKSSTPRPDRRTSDAPTGH